MTVLFFAGPWYHTWRGLHRGWAQGVFYLDEYCQLKIRNCNGTVCPRRKPLRVGESIWNVWPYLLKEPSPPGETVFSFNHRTNGIIEARCKLDESLPLLTMSRQISVEFFDVINIGLFACMAFHTPLIWRRWASRVGTGPPQPRNWKHHKWWGGGWFRAKPAPPPCNEYFNRRPDSAES